MMPFFLSLSGGGSVRRGARCEGTAVWGAKAVRCWEGCGEPGWGPAWYSDHRGASATDWQCQVAIHSPRYAIRERDLGVKQAWLNAMCIFQEDWLQWFTSSYAVINNTFSETQEFLKTVPPVLRCPWNTNEGETHSATQFWSFLHLVSDQSQTWYDI